MITASEMYWLTRMDNISSTFVGLAVPFCVVCVISLAVYVIHSSILATTTKTDEREFFTIGSRIARRVAIPSAIIFMVCLLGWVFTPTTRELAAIKVVPMLATEDVKEDASELYDLTVDWMKAQLKDSQK